MAPSGDTSTTQVDRDTAPGAAPDGTAPGAAVDSAASLLDRLRLFEEARGNGVVPPPRASQPLTTDPDVEVTPILPPSWRSEQAVRRRRRRRRRGRSERTWWRRARWSVLFFAIMAGAVAAAILVWVPRYAEDVAADVVADYAVALAEVDAALPGVPPVLADLAAVNLSGEDLANRIAPFGRFRAAATTLSGVARESLPELPPLFPDDAVAELAPLRERMSLIAGRADVLAGRIAKIATYRAAMAQAFVLPPLPTAVDGNEVNDLSLSLAQMIADSLDAATRLPSDPLLDAHRADVQSTLEWLRTWEIDYLEALRADDPATAQALINQARARISRLRGDLTEPLTEFQAWAADELDGLARDLDAGQLLVARAG